MPPSKSQKMDFFTVLGGFTHLAILLLGIKLKKKKSSPVSLTI